MDEVMFIFFYTLGFLACIYAEFMEYMGGF